MLAANEAVAGHLEQAASPASIGFTSGPTRNAYSNSSSWRPTSAIRSASAPFPRNAFRYVEKRRDGRKVRRDVTLASEEFNISSRNYQRLITKIAGKPEERILSYLMLRSLKQARYSNDNRGHFALAAQTYTHFTSPIRRYPDLVVHRILSQYLDTRQPFLDDSTLQPLGDDCSFTERRAAEAERELVESKKVKFMQDRVGEEFDALVISTTKFGFFVELTELFVEGLVPVESLPGDRFQYHENTRQIIGARTRRTFSIGDDVRVRLERADSVERRVNSQLWNRKRERRRKEEGARAGFKDGNELRHNLILRFLGIQVPGRIFGVQALQPNAGMLEALFCVSLFAPVPLDRISVLIRQLRVANQHQTSISGTHNTPAEHTQAAVRNFRFHRMSADVRHKHTLVKAQILWRLHPLLGVHFIRICEERAGCHLQRVNRQMGLKSADVRVNVLAVQPVQRCSESRTATASRSEIRTVWEALSSSQWSRPAPPISRAFNARSASSSCKTSASSSDEISSQSRLSFRWSRPAPRRAAAPPHLLPIRRAQRP